MHFFPFSLKFHINENQWNAATRLSKIMPCGICHMRVTNTNQYIVIHAASKISWLQLVSVAEQAGLSFKLLQTLKTG